MQPAPVYSHFRTVPKAGEGQKLLHPPHSSSNGGHHLMEHLLILAALVLGVLVLVKMLVR